MRHESKKSVLTVTNDVRTPPMNIKQVSKSSEAMKASGKRRIARNWGREVFPAHDSWVINVQIVEVSCKDWA